jgi:Carboxypeptidase regulatory-like domain
VVAESSDYQEDDDASLILERGTRRHTFEGFTALPKVLESRARLETVHRCSRAFELANGMRRTMSRNASVGCILMALAIIAVLPLGAAAQGTSAASISGVVTDSSGGVVPGVAIEVSSPVLIEKVRTTATNERGEYRVVELRPGTYAVTFARQGFASFRREGIELTSTFNAAVNAELRLGGIERSVTVSGATPLVDTENVARRTVI